jgi:hypothetical protein
MKAKIINDHLTGEGMLFSDNRRYRSAVAETPPGTRPALLFGFEIPYADTLIRIL